MDMYILSDAQQLNMDAGVYALGVCHLLSGVMKHACRNYTHTNVLLRIKTSLDDEEEGESCLGFLVLTS